MTRCARAVGALMVVAATWHAGADAQQLVADKSSVSFVIRQMGVPVEGRFTAFDATLALDPRKPEAGRVQFRIDLGSAQIGDADTTKELRKPEWFDTAKFGSASFASRSIKGLGGGRFDVTGSLGIKGSARDVAVPVTLVQSAGVTTASGQFTIKRADFRIGEGDWADTSIVANDVLVTFKLVLQGVAPL